MAGIAENTFKSYIMKLITGDLPTHETLHRKWDIYRDNLCPRCSNEVETQRDIWLCPQSTGTISDISAEVTTITGLEISTEETIRALQARPSQNMHNRLKNLSSDDYLHDVRDQQPGLTILMDS